MIDANVSSVPAGWGFKWRFVYFMFCLQHSAWELKALTHVASFNLLHLHPYFHVFEIPLLLEDELVLWLSHGNRSSTEAVGFFRASVLFTTISRCFGMSVHLFNGVQITALTERQSSLLLTSFLTSFCKKNTSVLNENRFINRSSSLLLPWHQSGLKIPSRRMKRSWQSSEATPARNQRWLLSLWCS